MSWKGRYIIGLCLCGTLQSLQLRPDSKVEQKPMKTYTFSDPVYNILWNQKEKVLSVFSYPNDIYLDNDLNRRNEIYNTSDVLSCPRMTIKCKNQHIQDKHISAMLVDTENIVVPCKHQQSHQCVEGDPNEYYEYELTLRHTKESMCSTEEDFTTHLNKDKTFDEIFSVPLEASIVEAMARNKSKYKSLNKANKLSLLFSYQPRTSKNQKLYFANGIINSTFLYGFTHGQFVYIMLTESSELGVTKTYLVRFCKNEHSLFSHTDMTLSCPNEDRTIIFGRATAAYLVKKMNVENPQVREANLYVTFEKYDIKENRESSAKSILCVFSFALIENAFQIEAEYYAARSVIDHYTETSQSKYDNKAEGEIMATFSERASALAVQTQYSETVAFVGTSHGNLLKFVLRRNAVSLRRYNVSLRKHLPIASSKPVFLKSVTFNSKEDHLFVLLNETVIKFDVYSCSFYDHPKKCYNSNLFCSWYNGSCLARNKCFDPCKATWKEYSEPARITLVSPRSGPLSGGTILKLNVTFGPIDSVSVKSEQVAFSIQGVTCKQENWVEYSQLSNYQWSVECTTGPVHHECTVPVVMKIFDGFSSSIILEKNSTEDFHYLKPRLNGIKPGFGPKAGGTNVTFYGENLNIGSKQNVFLSGLNCTIIKNNGTTIICTTREMPSNPDSEMKSKFVTIRIDNEVVKPYSPGKNLANSFEYRPNPSIYRIQPNVTIFSGIKRIKVFGHHLDSVAVPRINVTIISDQYEMVSIEKCDKTEYWGLKCPIPSLRGDITIRKPTKDYSLRATLSFIMDGVENKNLYKEGRQFYLDYYPDPELDHFEETLQEEDITPEIVVKGKNINTALTSEDVAINVNGVRFCDVTNLTFSEVHCVPDQKAVSRLRKREAQVYQIQAILGLRSYDLGNISISKQDDDETKYKIAFTFALIGVVSVVVSSFLLFGFKAVFVRYRRQRQPQVNAIDNHPERSGSPEQDNLLSPKENRSGSSTEEIPSAQNNSERESSTRKELLEQLVLSNLLVEREYITLKSELGTGQFGIVYKGVLTVPSKSPQTVAVKTIKKNCSSSTQQSNELIREGMMMKDFHHPHVLEVLGFCIKSSGIPMIILPYMEHGDLHSYIRNDDYEITMHRLITFGTQIAEGMKYLAQHNFVHRDLAARNCTLDQALSVKIGDFGLSRDVYEKHYYSSNNTDTPLPIRWMAPETLVLPRRYTEKSDVWSFGIVLWELTTRGVTPYTEFDNTEVTSIVLNGHMLLQTTNCPDNIYTLMISCWNNKGEKRPTFKELLVQLKSIQREDPVRELHKKVGLQFSLVKTVNYRKEAFV